MQIHRTTVCFDGSNRLDQELKCCPAGDRELSVLWKTCKDMMLFRESELEEVRAQEPEEQLHVYGVQ